METESVTLASGGILLIFRETNQLSTDMADIAQGAVPLAIVSVKDGLVTLVQKMKATGILTSIEIGDNFTPPAHTSAPPR